MDKLSLATSRIVNSISRAKKRIEAAPDSCSECCSDPVSLSLSIHPTRLIAPPVEFPSQDQEPLLPQKSEAESK